MDVTVGSLSNVSHSIASAEILRNLTPPRHSYYFTAFVLWKYFPPFLMLFGTFGNILTILILCRKSMWKMSSAPYLVVLSMADIVVLYTGLLRQWVRYLVDIDIRELSPVLCKLHIFSVYASIDFSVWILVAVSVERFIGVCFPFKAKTLCTRRRTQITLSVIFCLLVILNSHFFFGLGSIYDNSTGVSVLISHCNPLSNQYTSFYENIWPWIDLAVFSIVPFCLIIVCNISLIVRILYSHRRHRVAPTDARTTVGVSSSSMTALFISLNTLFLVTTAPISIYLIGYPRWSRAADDEEAAVLALWWAVVNMLMYLNNSLNFILYCLSGPRFRRELRLICARRHKVGVTTPPPCQLPSCRKSKNIHCVRSHSQPSLPKEFDKTLSLSQQPPGQLMPSQLSINHVPVSQQSNRSSQRCVNQPVPSKKPYAHSQCSKKIGLHTYTLTPSTLKPDPLLSSNMLDSNAPMCHMEQTEITGRNNKLVLERDSAPANHASSSSVV